MEKNFNKKWLAISLLVLAVALLVIGVQAITSIQIVMTKAYAADPGSSIEKMVAAWPELVFPLVVCLAVASGVFLIAASLAFSGKLTISYKTKV